MELNKEIVKLANEIKEYSEKSGQSINFIIEACATDFHPEFSEPIGELVDEIFGWDCWTERTSEMQQKYEQKYNEIICRIGMELELEA